MKSVSQFILEARTTANLSQVQLAEKIGVSANNIYRWESGRTMPLADTLLSVLDACGLEISVTKLSSK